MSTEQVIKIAAYLADLQSTLDVYKGLFLEISDAEVILDDFPEIGTALKNSMSVKLIIGCAAIFTDPHTTNGDENLSLSNLYSKYKDNFLSDTIALKTSIDETVAAMNLKKFRNKHVGHFGLEESLGYRHVPREITTINIEKIIISAQELINLIIRDAQLLPPRHSLALYSAAPESRSTKAFLKRLRST